VEVLVAANPIAGLTRIMPKDRIEREARISVERLKELLPRQQFTQAIQASVRGRIIARETIPAMKKKLGDFGKNGGDRTRKMKLWKKQKEGKERLKERGESTQIKIPASIFKELMKK
jgi:GTP-binding protein LepA